MQWKEYVKRLSPFCRISVLELPSQRSPPTRLPPRISAAIAGEGKRIISKIPSGSYVFSMCIEGEQLSSEQLAGHIAHVTLEGKSSLCFIIGGSFGLSDDVKKASDFRLSMSRMTFPHQLARVLLVETALQSLQYKQQRENTTSDSYKGGTGVLLLTDAANARRFRC